MKIRCIFHFFHHPDGERRHHLEYWFSRLHGALRLSLHSEHRNPGKWSPFTLRATSPSVTAIWGNVFQVSHSSYEGCAAILVAQNLSSLNWIILLRNMRHSTFLPKWNSSISSQSLLSGSELHFLTWASSPHACFGLFLKLVGSVSPSPYFSAVRTRFLLNFSCAGLTGKNKSTWTLGSICPMAPLGCW